MGLKPIRAMETRREAFTLRGLLRDWNGNALGVATQDVSGICFILYLSDRNGVDLSQNQAVSNGAVGNAKIFGDWAGEINRLVS
jgi:hypothetical protein